MCNSLILSPPATLFVLTASTGDHRLGLRDKNLADEQQGKTTSTQHYIKEALGEHLEKQK